jgi:hypothetical protein
MADPLRDIGDHAPIYDRKISGEQKMFAAVVANAWADAFIRVDASINAIDRQCDPVIERQEASRWLTSDLEPWRSDREEVCDLAGFDPDLISTVARKKLAEVKAAEAKDQTATVIPLDMAFANLLVESNPLNPAELDAALEALATLEGKAAPPKLNKHFYMQI